jgi:ComF family protein
LSGFDGVFAYGEYAGALRSLIHLFKYGGIPTLAPVLAKRMMLALPRGQVFDAIVPMPMHWRRRWRRGFNQSELLAAEVGRRLGVPVRKVLRKRKATPAQAGLTSAQRRKNVAGAFEIRGRDRMEGGHLLLVDDVFTTGATAAACAAALKRGGAERVTVLTLARADRRRGIVRASS